MLYPLRVHVGNSAPEFGIATITETLARDFGGVTVRHGTGAWVDPAGSVEMENVLEILVAVPSDRRNEVIAIVERLYPREKAFGVEWRGEYFILHRGERLS